MIYFTSIVLDGMPYLPTHIHTFNRLSMPWQWLVAEGVSRPVRDTSWCKEIPARVSNDGSHEYLKELASHHPRVTHLARPSWDGKTAMFNELLKNCRKPGLLFQVDVDELWTAPQIEVIYNLFKSNPSMNCARFFCRYYIGQNIQITSQNSYGNRGGEWLRVWRYQPGMSFSSHEPPRLQPMVETCFSREETAKLGLVFDHPAYATVKQVAFKEQYYGYADAVNQWKSLQQNTVWPARVGNFLKWVTDDSVCDLVHR